MAMLSLLPHNANLTNAKGYESRRAFFSAKDH